LRLLKVPVGAGYEQVIASLGRRPGVHRGVERDMAPRQFIFGDGAGGVERIRIDLSGPHLDHLRLAMDTTPDAMRDSTPGAVVPAETTAAAPPDEYALEPPAVDGSEESDLDFEMAADFELGLTDDELDPVDPAGKQVKRKDGNREDAA
jgi:hypothetical protein